MMQPRKRNTTYRSNAPLLVGGVVLSVMLLGVVATAWMLGAFRSPTPVKIDRTGQVAFPAIARPVAAFEAITRDDLLHPQTKELNVVWLPKSAEGTGLRDLGQILGRVLKRDKAPGFILSESDFLPKGTRPGATAGIPPNKFAISIPCDGIPGLDVLRNGDHFDLLISLEDPKDGRNGLSNTEPAALFGGVKPPSLRVGQLSRQHGIKKLVDDGHFVALVQGSKQSTTGTQGLVVPPSGSKNKPVPTAPKFAEVAVAEEEVGPLTEAIGLNARIICVTRSSQPTDAPHQAFTTEGLVPVITTAKDVPAFSALSDENLIDDGTSQLHYYYFPPDRISKSWIMDPIELYGRVLARSMRRGSVITEGDLLPLGTKAGISAGVPRGMVAMSLERSRVQGIDRLTLGDRFSMLTKLPDTVTRSAPSVSWSTLVGGQLSPEDAKLEQMVKTGIREVVADGIFLGEASIGEKSENPNFVTIAIPELEVVRVAQLVRDGADIFVVTKSSREGLPPDAVTPSAVNPEARRSSDSHHTPLRLTALQSPADPIIPTKGTLSPFSSNQEPATPQGTQPADTLAIPVLARSVQAFERIQLADFMDPSTGKLRLLYFPKEKVGKDWRSDLLTMIDRVSARPLEEGRVVREGDLLPEGTMAGPAAGIPQGMRGITVNSLQVRGLEGIRPGGHFDLVLAQSLSVGQLGDSARRSLASHDAVREASKLPSGNVPSARAIASDAMMVASLGEIQVTIERRTGPIQRQTQTHIHADGSTVTETIVDDPTTQQSQLAAQQYILAVSERVAGQVLAMLDVQNPLQVAARSTVASGVDRNLSQSTAEQRDNDDPTPVQAVVIEHIRGKEIQSEVFLTDRAHATSIPQPPQQPTDGGW